MTNLRWKIAFLCLYAGSISWLDRAALGIALPYMNRELHFDPVQAGYAFSAFSLLTLLAILVTGMAADRVGARRLGATAVSGWSISVAFMAVVQGPISLIGLRALLGLFEAGGSPSWIRATMTWFPPSERARAVALFDSGARVGPTLAFPIMAALIGIGGWRLAFVGIGILGLAWVPLWFRTYRDDPKLQPKISRTELDHIKSGHPPIGPAEAVPVRWLELLAAPKTWALVLLSALSACQGWFNLSWVPTCLVEVRHFTLLHVGLLGAAPGLAGILFGFLSGVLADHLFSRGYSITFVRKGCIVAGLGLSCCIALLPFVSSLTVAMLLLSLAAAGFAFGSAALFTLPLDMTPCSSRAASLGSIQIFGALISGLLFPLLMGYVLKWSGGSFMLPFILAGLASFLAAGVCLFVLGPIEPIQIPGNQGVNYRETSSLLKRLDGDNAPTSDNGHNSRQGDVPFARP